MNLGKTFTLLCNSFDMNLNHPDNLLGVLAVLTTYFRIECRGQRLSC